MPISERVALEDTTLSRCGGPDGVKTPLYTEGPEGTDLHECDATFGKISGVRVLKLLSPRLGGEEGGGWSLGPSKCVGREFLGPPLPFPQLYLNFAGAGGLEVRGKSCG